MISGRYLCIEIKNTFVSIWLVENLENAVVDYGSFVQSIF